MGYLDLFDRELGESLDKWFSWEEVGIRGGREAWIASWGIVEDEGHIVSHVGHVRVPAVLRVNIDMVWDLMNDCLSAGKRDGGHPRKRLLAAG